jgi:hypothetical protein
MLTKAIPKKSIFVKCNFPESELSSNLYNCFSTSLQHPPQSLICYFPSPNCLSMNPHRVLFQVFDDSKQFDHFKGTTFESEIMI